MTSKALVHARNKKDNEFYTKYPDIERELKHYDKHLKGKTIYCNCDDYRWSNFPKYFIDNFNELQLKKLIVTGLNCPAYIYDGKEVVIKDLVWFGQFDSPECAAYLKECDVIVTNPPFSLFRKYFDILLWSKKDFIVVGNKIAMMYSNVWDNLLNGKINLGIEKQPFSGFITPDGKGGGPDGRWYTTFKLQKELKSIPLVKEYNPIDYPKYLHEDAINVDRTKNIPKDYYGVIGVPATYFERHNPNDFQIVGRLRCTSIEYNPDKHKGEITHIDSETGKKCINKFWRIGIKRVKK